ncbi:hypothetical protein GALMADRAFT_227662 [Galerina marginata CBS 339.88]|uniref:F-box domain-containing protein n=1 Tax=Galerina marginata (strain CBS 339.88) TaxID=685588 RepID=A0A067SSV7_GALM3|nr:hypothetical protein GALMADRAFT_227662 [Galerina marginata CBS 339.88]
MLYRPYATHPDTDSTNTTFSNDDNSQQDGIQHQEQQEHEHGHYQRALQEGEGVSGLQQRQYGLLDAGHASAPPDVVNDGIGDGSGAELIHETSLLLSVPPETLVSVTSHLSPPDLLALGCTSVVLAEHVRADNTWRRAFVFHFLGISPEGDLDDTVSGLGHDQRPYSTGRTILLRRQKESWRDEFIWRYVMIRRWSRSKNLPVTHTPVVQSPIAAMHLLPSQPASSLPATAARPKTIQGLQTPALLTASTQYGIVARSFPLQGKVLPGYLDASAGARDVLHPNAGNGHIAPGWANLQANANLNWGMQWNWAMNGNPNAQFTPNISACSLSSTSGSRSEPATATATAVIAWGTRAGDVIFTTAPRAMDVGVNPRRAANARNVVDLRGIGVRVRRCAVGEKHEGSVEDVRWVGGEVSGERKFAVTAGADGRVKLWDTSGTTAVLNADGEDDDDDDSNSMLLWTSDLIVRKERLGVVPEPVVRAEGLVNAGLGCIVGVTQSGDVHVWAGFRISTDEDDGTTALSATDVWKVVVPCPMTGHDQAASPVVKALFIDLTDTRAGVDGVVFLVAYEDDPLFYRISVHLNKNGSKTQVDIMSFGDPNFGRTSVVVPFFGLRSSEEGKKKTESSFVLVGDHIGCVSLYPWNTQGQGQSQLPLQPIAPLRTFEAHRDGASVTALWWDGLTLVTGSSRGTTHVWDGLTFAHLRSFVSPVKRVRGGHQHGANANANVHGEPGREAVKHVLIGEAHDVLVVAVGDCVMAWHAGPVAARDRGDRGGGVRGRHAPGTGLHGGKKRGGGGGVHIRPYEMRQTILESRDMLASEAQTVRAVYGREREHRTGLDNLGLSEVEAVEYVLMLSRDEENARASARAQAEAEAEREEGVFEGDFDDEPGDEEDDDISAFGAPSLSSRSSSSSSGSSGLSSSGSSSALSRGTGRSLSNTATAGRPIPSRPRVGPSTSNEKVQISPPYRGEPTQAGEEYFAGDVDQETETELLMEDNFFPPISASTSPAQSSSSVSSPVSLKGKGKGKGKGKKANKNKEKPETQSTAGSKTKESPKKTRMPTPTKTTPAPTSSGSPSSLKSSAWSVPLTKRASSSSASMSSHSPPSRNLGSGSGSNLGWASSRMSPPRPDAGGAGQPSFIVGDDEMDADLRFALELSLVEARSRGEDV